MGWDEIEEHCNMEILYDIGKLQYEIENCTRGSYFTSCTTYPELADCIRDLANRLNRFADSVERCAEYDEDYEDDDIEESTRKSFNSMVESQRSKRSR